MVDEDMESGSPLDPDTGLEIVEKGGDGIMQPGTILRGSTVIPMPRELGEKRRRYTFFGKPVEVSFASDADNVEGSEAAKRLQAKKRSMPEMRAVIPRRGEGQDDGVSPNNSAAHVTNIDDGPQHPRDPRVRLPLPLQQRAVQCTPGIKAMA
ncbi:hypothetical protein HDU67_002367 [Dinochytrium kinnereticum]|nr:hypothetical protein HDU67_002367 [Dinochytrium kinnereticum]